MKTRKEAINACLSFSGAYEDYPFDDFNWAVMRHEENKKSFAMIFEHDGKTWINVKANPAAGELWREVYEDVVPAYHMNKIHWIGIILGGTMADEDVLRLIADSYALTADKTRKKNISPVDD